MDNKQFLAYIAKSLSIETKEAAEACQSLFEIMTQCIIDNDTITIPAFGTFSLKKADEEITTDLSTGKRILLPPQLSMEFATSTILTKRLNEYSQK